MVRLIYTQSPFSLVLLSPLSKHYDMIVLLIFLCVILTNLELLF